MTMVCPEKYWPRELTINNKKSKGVVDSPKQQKLET